MPSFIADAISVSRKHAGLALRNLASPSQLLSLAAHAYAITCLIPAKIGVVNLVAGLSKVPKFKNLRQGVKELAVLPPEVESSDFMLSSLRSSSSLRKSSAEPRLCGITCPPAPHWTKEVPVF